MNKTIKTVVLVIALLVGWEMITSGPEAFSSIASTVAQEIEDAPLYAKIGGVFGMVVVAGLQFMTGLWWGDELSRVVMRGDDPSIRAVLGYHMSRHGGMTVGMAAWTGWSLPIIAVIGAIIGAVKIFQSKVKVNRQES